MAVFNNGAQQIGSVAPGYLALGRTSMPTAAQRFAGNNRLVSSPMASSALARLASAGLAVAPVATQQSSGPVEGPNPTGVDTGIPRPVLIGAGVVGVLVIGLVAFKLHKG